MFITRLTTDVWKYDLRSKTMIRKTKRQITKIEAMIDSALLGFFKIHRHRFTIVHKTRQTFQYVVVVYQFIRWTRNLWEQRVYTLTFGMYCCCCRLWKRPNSKGKKKSPNTKTIIHKTDNRWRTNLNYKRNAFRSLTDIVTTLRKLNYVPAREHKNIHTHRIVRLKKLYVL